MKIPVIGAPKFKGLVGEIAGGEHAGKFAFKVLITFVGDPRERTLIASEPFDTKESAKTEMNRQLELCLKKAEGELKKPTNERTWNPRKLGL